MNIAAGACNPNTGDGKQMDSKNSLSRQPNLNPRFQFSERQLSFKAMWNRMIRKGWHHPAPASPCMGACTYTYVHALPTNTTCTCAFMSVCACTDIHTIV